MYENIAYGSEKATREDVERVCKACGIHDYIRTLPAGYETVLEDDGANISKGQKQLMTIARAMLLESSLLILDEATSNVDTRTELRIQKAMRTLMADKTCFGHCAPLIDYSQRGYDLSRARRRDCGARHA